MMLFTRKSVLCTNCGFFCWRIQHESGEGPFRFEETGRQYREGFQAANPDYQGQEIVPDYEEEYKIFCLRRQWFLSSTHHEGRPEYVCADDIRELRQCPYYIRYQPAFGPEEHKELKGEDETRRSILKAALIGAIIGASAAIISQILYARFVALP